MLINVITGFFEQIKFSLNWRLTIFTCLLFPGLMLLGFWQLDRAQEKQQIIDAQQQQQRLPAVPLESISDAVNFRKVTVSGYFETDRYWLLDNKIHSGQIGYEVVIPLILESDKSSRILVNLGWLPAPRSREHLPSVKLPSGLVTLDGILSAPSKNAVFDSSSVTHTSWPRRVLQVDRQLAELALGVSFRTQALLIDPFDPRALMADWKLINQTPAKHHGYAVQWFSMALALLITMLFANSNLALLLKAKQTNNNNEKEVATRDKHNG